MSLAKDGNAWMQVSRREAGTISREANQPQGGRHKKAGKRISRRDAGAISREAKQPQGRRH